MRVGSEINGIVSIFGPGGKEIAALDYAGNNPDHGWIGVLDSAGIPRARMYVDDNSQGGVSVDDSSNNNRAIMQVLATGEGYFEILGPNGKDIVRLAANSENRNMGYISVHDDQERTRARIYVDSEGNGWVSIDDKNGNQKARMYVNDKGEGVVSADLIEGGEKNFVTPHPNRPGYNIVYTSLEGPEAAMFCRGKVQLQEGRGTIQLSEHFTALASPDSLTVQLTPASLDSKGVAFIKSGTDTVEIGELQGGKGSYEVHYVVYALRAGFENEQPVVAIEKSKGSLETGSSNDNSQPMPRAGSSQNPSLEKGSSKDTRQPASRSGSALGRSNR